MGANFKSIDLGAGDKKPHYLKYGGASFPRRWRFRRGFKVDKIKEFSQGRARGDVWVSPAALPGLSISWLRGAITWRLGWEHSRESRRRSGGAEKRSRTILVGRNEGSLLPHEMTAFWKNGTVPAAGRG